MVTVCAWCEKYMGSMEPLEDPGVSHGICSACVERQTLADAPVVVVNPARVATIPLLRALLRGSPDVTIVVDRRNGDRRNGNGHGNGHGRGNGNGRGKGNGHGGRTRGRHSAWVASERRQDKRRRSSALYLV